MIAADGQILKEESTVEAIVKASNCPLSIVMVGVGDGPWDKMVDFHDRIPARTFDNFAFVDFAQVVKSAKKPEACFALHALMDIPGNLP